MSLTGISANRLELLQIAEAVAREKSIDKEIVIEAIEEAIQKGARSRYGAEHDIRVHIDPKTGETIIKRVITVIPDDLIYEAEDSEDGPSEPMGSRRLASASRSMPGGSSTGSSTPSSSKPPPNTASSATTVITRLMVVSPVFGSMWTRISCSAP